MTTPTELHTSIPAASGTFWLTGWRESKWNTARFSLSLDYGDDTDKILTNADWPMMRKELSKHLKTRCVEETMRSVLPPA